MDIVVKTADKLSILLVETEADAAIEVIANALKLLEHNLFIFDNFEQIIHLAPKTIGYWASPCKGNNQCVHRDVSDEIGNPW